MLPDSTKIWRSVEGPDGEHVYLLKWHNEPNMFRNMVKFSRGGNLIWTVKAAHPREAVYSEIEIQGKIIKAYNMAGYSEQIDYVTGDVLHRKFVKQTAEG